MVSKANHDIGAACTIFKHEPEYTDIVCYHCQQAVEKYLKAYLIYLDIDFKKSHDSTYLLDLLNERENISDDLYEYAQNVEDHAVEVRYPGGIEMPTSKEAEEAIKTGKIFKSFIKSKFNKV